MLTDTLAYTNIELMFAPLREPQASAVLYMDVKRRAAIEKAGFIACAWPAQMPQPDKSSLAQFFIMCGKRTPFGLYVQCAQPASKGDPPAILYYVYVEEHARVL